MSSTLSIFMDFEDRNLTCSGDGVCGVCAGPNRNLDQFSTDSPLSSPVYTLCCFCNTTWSRYTSQTCSLFPSTRSSCVSGLRSCDGLAPLDLDVFVCPLVRGTDLHREPPPCSLPPHCPHFLLSCHNVLTCFTVMPGRPCNVLHFLFFFYVKFFFPQIVFFSTLVA